MVTLVWGKNPIARSGRVTGFRAWKRRDLGSAERGKEGHGGVNKSVLCLFGEDFFLYLDIWMCTCTCTYSGIERRR